MHELEQLLTASWPPVAWKDFSVVVAVSGGADSLALLHSLVRVRELGRGRLIVAHFNHGLRGAESDHDAEFTAQVATSLGLPVVRGRSQSPGERSSHQGLEAAARSERYAFLLEAAENAGARFLATAHTADDQAETMLHHILRGTGLDGLSGMPRCRLLSPAVTLIRPLLQVRRKQTLAYLETLGQRWCEDSTNGDTQFTRNRIRHELLPRLAADYNPLVVESLLRLGEQAGAALELVRQQAERLAQCAEFDASGQVRLAVQPLTFQPRHLIRELMVVIWRRQNWPLQEMGFEQWDRLAELVLGAAADPSSLGAAAGGQGATLPGRILAQRRQGEIRLFKLEP